MELGALTRAIFESLFAKAYFPRPVQHHLWTRNEVQSIFVEYTSKHILYRSAGWCRVFLFWLRRDTGALDFLTNLYSYSCNVPKGSSEEVSDDIAAFLYIFFENFGSFRGRPFHFTGESYAVSAICLPSHFLPSLPLCQGRYLPVYASKLYDTNSELVAKGSSITPVNLTSVVIGVYSIKVSCILSR